MCAKTKTRTKWFHAEKKFNPAFAALSCTSNWVKGLRATTIYSFTVGAVTVSVCNTVLHRQKVVVSMTYRGPFSSDLMYLAEPDTRTAPPCHLRLWQTPPTSSFSKLQNWHPTSEQV